MERLYTRIVPSKWMSCGLIVEEVVGLTAGEK